MPADRGPRPILIDQDHRECFRSDAGPLRDFGAKWPQRFWNRPLDFPIVRLAKERHTATGYDATHFEVRKRDVCHPVKQAQLFGAGDEVVAIVKAPRDVLLEEPRRIGHVSSLARCVVFAIRPGA